MCPMFIDKSNQYNHPYWKPKLLSMCVLALCVCVCVCIYVCARARMHVCVHVLTQLHPTLCDPRDCGPPGSSVHVILQARILEWVAISYSKGSSQPREQTQVTCIVRQILSITVLPGKPVCMYTRAHSHICSISLYLSRQKMLSVLELLNCQIRSHRLGNCS